MSYITILIPLVGGVLLVAFPQLLTRSSGATLEQAKVKLRRIGVALIGAAAFYSLARLGDSGGLQKSTQEKPQMEMHRMQAETPGVSGWYLGESTYGSFVVQLPIPFNDFTVSAHDPKLGTIKT